MEIDDDKEENILTDLKKIVFQMLSILSNTGSILHIIGQIKECEECYSFYIASIEALFGENTREAANCYFLIGLNYFKERKHFYKAKFSFLKSLMIMQGYCNDP